MNQQCKVCGEPAAGFHFGAFTCEGCKVNIEICLIFTVLISGINDSSEIDSAFGSEQFTHLNRIDRLNLNGKRKPIVLPTVTVMNATLHFNRQQLYCLPVKYFAISIVCVCVRTRALKCINVLYCIEWCDPTRAQFMRPNRLDVPSSIHNKYQIKVSINAWMCCASFLSLLTSSRWSIRNANKPMNMERSTSKM